MIEFKWSFQHLAGDQVVVSVSASLPKFEVRTDNKGNLRIEQWATPDTMTSYTDWMPVQQFAGIAVDEGTIYLIPNLRWVKV